VFQALRIEVNRELNVLADAIPAAMGRSRSAAASS
jgi:16S rRNA C1402 N4-methylase RsmH